MACSYLVIDEHALDPHTGFDFFVCLDNNPWNIQEKRQCACILHHTQRKRSTAFQLLESFTIKKREKATKEKQYLCNDVRICVTTSSSFKQKPQILGLVFNKIKGLQFQIHRQTHTQGFAQKSCFVPMKTFGPDMVYARSGPQYVTKMCIYTHTHTQNIDVVIPEMANPLKPTARTRKEMATPRVWENPTTNSSVASIPNPVPKQFNTRVKEWVKSSCSRHDEHFRIYTGKCSVKNKINLTLSRLLGSILQ